MRKVVSRSDAALQEHIKRVLDCQPSPHFDAGETLAFAEELKYVFTEVYREELVPQKARVILPVNTSVPSGAKSWAFRNYQGFGKAKVVDDFASDFPNVELSGTETVGKVVSFGSSYQYSIQDIRQAAMFNFPLETEKAMLARQVIEIALDQTAAVGDVDHGIKGFVKGQESDYNVATKVGVTWDNAAITPKIIVDDVKTLFSSIFLTTKGTHTGTQLILGTKGFSKVMNTDYSYIDGGTTIFSGKTVYQYLLSGVVPGLTSIVHWPRLDTAGAGSTERIMAWEAGPNVAQMVIPQEFEQIAPQARGMTLLINCHMRFAGVKVVRPKAIGYMDGTEAT